MADKKCSSTSRIGRAGTVDLVPSTAKSLDAKMAESYANEIKLAAQGAQQVLISSDASVISRENTMFYAAWWPEREQGGWLLPMVWWRWERGRKQRSCTHARFA